jgi:N-acetylmuramoyl-L-alanine amidase
MSKLGSAIAFCALVFGSACLAGTAQSATPSSPSVPAVRSKPSKPLAVPSVGGQAAPATAVAVPKPAIVWKPIAFGRKRKAQMAAYSLRHYGKKTWVLTNPKVIVEHYTASSTFSSAWYTFAGNAPNLGEEPGVCAQFIIDRDGTIYQLVHLNVRCRHTVGLNYTAIGIEDVGTSDAQILNDRAQITASLRLTLWLTAHFGIQLRNVIGHAEALTSPYHHELYPTWQCQVHGDWQHADMNRYRVMLKKRMRKYGVPIGPPPHWITPHC